MINVFFKDMPSRIKAVHTKNDDGSYSIFLNSRLSKEVQLSGYVHEICHIDKEDIDSVDDIDTLEFYAHVYDV